jgi:hypothetical protein
MIDSKAQRIAARIRSIPMDWPGSEDAKPEGGIAKNLARR